MGSGGSTSSRRYKKDDLRFIECRLGSNTKTRSFGRLSCVLRGAGSQPSYRNREKQVERESTTNAVVSGCGASVSAASPQRRVIAQSVRSDGGGQPIEAAPASLARRPWGSAYGPLPPLAPPASRRQLTLNPEQFASSSAVARMASDYWKQERRSSPRLAPVAAVTGSSPNSRVPTASSVSTSAGRSSRVSDMSSTSAASLLA